MDSEVFDIQEAIARSKNAEAYAIERKVSASDLQLVRESLRIQYVIPLYLSSHYNGR